MTDSSISEIAIQYETSGYFEGSSSGMSSAVGMPQGIMGRQVAGHAFLDALLQYGQWSTLVAITESPKSAESLIRYCQSHSSSVSRRRRLQVVTNEEFLGAFTSHPPANVVYTPCPPDERFAWARATVGRPCFALCGVTHTLCTTTAVRALCGMLTSPFESCDTLICTSRAVADMVRAVWNNYSDYYRDRFGAEIRPRINLTTIPLGVHVDRFHPATPAEREQSRHAIGIASDEVMVLCVGRLSHHAKAHPFPLYTSAAHAAKATGRKIHLVFAGWASHPAVERAFREGSVQLAPGVRTSFLDGQSDAVRNHVWRAADIFASLPDNIQETFGLVIVEAMASGLPVLASDWNGYRDLVVPDVTGFLVPTRIVQNATRSTVNRLMCGAVSYDKFLAESSQAVQVDAEVAGRMLTRLVSEDSTRMHMGHAGRARAESVFSWERVIQAYESLWCDQQREVRQVVEDVSPRGWSLFPAPDVAFSSYPTEWLGDDVLIEVGLGSDANLNLLLNMPLTNHAAERRCTDPVVLGECVTRATYGKVTIGDLVNILSRRGQDDESARCTIAWLLKYGLLRRIGDAKPPRSCSKHD